jgi:hypothetical protein
MVITYAENEIEFNSQRNFSSPTRGASLQETVENTFRYIASQTQKGIFIKIHNNCLVNFIVFNVKNNVENLWGENIRVDPRFFKNILEFMKHVARKTNAPFLPRAIEENVSRWRCNNGLLRFEVPPKDNRKNEECIHDMFVQLCRECIVPDVEVFFNKRDFPIKRGGPFEPFHHIWDSKRKPLGREVHKEYSPILSQCIESDFSDITVPTYEDWGRARESEDGVRFEDSRVGMIFKPVEWSLKKTMAVFRGTTTGIGTSSENNTRMKLVKICEKFPALFDVGFTRINYRPRKQYKNPFLQTVEERFKCVEPLSLQQQIGFKFIINVEGHSAAFRLSSELVSGSCVLIVESKWKMWLHPFLKPYEHFVPIKSDLSDLVSQVRWCVDNDQRCFEIAQRSRSLSETLLSKRGILEYLKNKLDAIGGAVVYSDRFLYRHNPQETSNQLTNLVLPSVEFHEAEPEVFGDEANLLVNLTIRDAHERYRMQWGNKNICVRACKKKSCLPFLLEGRWYQLWSCLKIFWPCSENTVFALNDVWFGPLTYKPLSDLDRIPFEKITMTPAELLKWSSQRGIAFREDCCVSRNENRLFQHPVFTSDNLFLLTYYCVRILSFIPKSAQNSERDDVVWKRWQDTLHFATTYFRDNVTSTRALPLSFEIYTFPNSEKKRLCDYTKWNTKIKTVLNHTGPFALSETNKKFYSSHFEPLLTQGDDYTFLVASHNAVVAYFENPR